MSLLLADSAAVMSEAIRLVLATTLPSCSTVRAASVASSVERLAEPRIALIWLWASIIAGAGGRDEIGLRLAQRSVLLLVQGRDLEPLARGRAEALDHVLDVLHGLGEVGDDRLVGAEFDDLAELLQRDRLGFLHLLGTFVQSLFAARGQQCRPLAGKARALRR